MNLLGVMSKQNSSNDTIYSVDGIPNINTEEKVLTKLEILVSLLILENLTSGTLKISRFNSSALTTSPNSLLERSKNCKIFKLAALLISSSNGW